MTDPAIRQLVVALRRAGKPEARRVKGMHWPDERGRCPACSSDTGTRPVQAPCRTLVAAEIVLGVRQL